MALMCYFALRLLGEDGALVLDPASTDIDTRTRHQARDGAMELTPDDVLSAEQIVEQQEPLDRLAKPADASTWFNAQPEFDDILQTLIDTSPVGVVVLDAKRGEVVRANREAWRMFSGLHTPEKAPARPLNLLTIRRADGREISLSEFRLASAFTEGETIRAEKIVVTRTGGRSLTALINATPIRSPDGNISSVVVTVQDMTLFEDLDQLRADLLGTVSEELRAPLVAVKGAAATLLESRPLLGGAEATQLVRVIDVQANRIRDLLGEFVDLARIETGGLDLDLELTDPMQLLSGVAAASRCADPSGGILIDTAPDLPPVTADRRRMAQALDIVLAVVKGSSDDAAPVRVSAAADGVLLRLDVFRDGSDAESAQPADLFDVYTAVSMGDPYSNVGGSRTRVAVCKGIVEAHGGRVRAERHGDGHDGIRVSLTLPLAQPNAAAPWPQAERGSRRSAAATRVLVIEAIASTQQFLHDTLSNAGYDVAIAADISEALARAAARAPDLILADMVAGGSDVIDTVAALSSRTEAPIIVMAAPGDDKAGVRAVEAGAADYLIKRFSPTELLARTRAALHRSAAPSPTGRARQLSVGFLTIDLATREVTIAGEPVRLTMTEYLLLRELAASAGRVLDHDQLMRRVWQTDSPSAAGIVRSAVKRLRRKLGDDARDSIYIVTAPRMGYRIGSGTPAAHRNEAPEPSRNGIATAAAAATA